MHPLAVKTTPLMNYTHTQHTTTHTPKLKPISVPVNTTPTKHQHQQQPPDNTGRRAQDQPAALALPVRVSLFLLLLPPLNSTQRNATHSPSTHRHSFPSTQRHANPPPHLTQPNATLPTTPL